MEYSLERGGRPYHIRDSASGGDLRTEYVQVFAGHAGHAGGNGVGMCQPGPEVMQERFLVFICRQGHLVQGNTQFFTARSGIAQGEVLAAAVCVDKSLDLQAIVFYQAVQRVGAVLAATQAHQAIRFATVSAQTTEFVCQSVFTFGFIRGIIGPAPRTNIGGVKIAARKVVGHQTLFTSSHRISP